MVLAKVLQIENECLLLYQFRVKASRAKKRLQEKAVQKEKRKAEALAAGIDWISEESDNEHGVI